MTGSLTVRAKFWELSFNNEKSWEIQPPTSFSLLNLTAFLFLFLFFPLSAALRIYTPASSSPCPSCHHTTKYWNNVPLNLTRLLIKRAIWLLITKLPSHYVALSKNLLTSSSQEHPPLLASEWIFPIQFAGCSKLKNASWLLVQTALCSATCAYLKLSECSLKTTAEIL